MFAGMRVLFDIAHPAHVHFYRHLAGELTHRGHEWRIASRDKDVTNQLLESLGLPYVTASAARSGRVGLASELLERDLALFRIGRDFRPDLILTRNPSGTHAGRLLGIPSVFDTDNGRSAGIHYRAAAPFASVITTPDCFPAGLSRRQIRYPSYKALAFLHPNRFTPDHSVRERLGLGDAERHYIVRTVSMDASHDRGESGMSQDLTRRVIDLLRTQGRVFVSSESPLPTDLESLALPTKAFEFHNALATASLCVGDSGSVAQESALLGVPAVFVSSFAGRTAPLEELEHRYQLVRSFTPQEDPAAMAAIRDFLDTDTGAIQQRRRDLLEDKVDLTSWYVNQVELLA